MVSISEQKDVRSSTKVFQLLNKGLCQLESMRSEIMQITFNCQNSIVFNA